MTFRSCAGAIIVVSSLAGRAPILSAQGIEVSPVSGYRFDSNFFETVAGQQIDSDGAQALGIVLDVPLSNGVQVEGFFTHQEARVGVNHWRVSIDHWQGGGLQEFGAGRVRPFLTGTLGLTHYAAEASNELRFNLGAGGGVKLFATPHLGLRLDGRAFATFLDADLRASACGGLLFAPHSRRRGLADGIHGRPRRSFLITSIRKKMPRGNNIYCCLAAIH